MRGCGNFWASRRASSALSNEVIRTRIIPCLLIDDGDLVKTRQFANPVYVGDPINAVRIFNEKEVDELCLFDISASENKAAIDFQLLKDIAREANMPLTYGGGVANARDAAKLVSIGFEKISLNSAVIHNPALITEIGAEIGSQSVVVCVDVLETAPGKHEVRGARGKNTVSRDVAAYCRGIEELRAGEIIINCISRDGTRQGYDIELARRARAAVRCPLTIVGGAGSVADLNVLDQEVGPVGAAAGALFVFKGVNNAVLISYERPR